MRTHLYSSLAALKIGLDILFKEEKVQADEIFGHGGLFRTKGVGQGILAAAMDAPVSVMEIKEIKWSLTRRMWPALMHSFNGIGLVFLWKKRRLKRW